MRHRFFLLGAFAFVWLPVVPAFAQSAPADSSAAPTGKWVFAADSDDMTNKTDQRITLAADDSSEDRLGQKVLAHLVLSCGNTFTEDGPRAMLFDAAIPMATTHTIVSDVAELMLRTDTDDNPETKRVWTYDRGHTVAFIGGFGNPQFSGGFLKKLLRSKTLRVRYEPLEGNTTETVTFTVIGLLDALKNLTRCTWN